jgi:hypothetical protein
MKKTAVILCALGLAGCASQPQFGTYTRHHVAPKAAVVAPVAAPVAVTPLVKPTWYDDFRSAGKKFKSHFKKKDH